MSEYQVCLVPVEGRAGHRIPWTEVIDDCEHHHECGEPNPGSIQEQQVASTTEPSLESMLIIFSPKVLDKNTFSRKPFLTLSSTFVFSFPQYFPFTVLLSLLPPQSSRVTTQSELAETRNDVLFCFHLPHAHLGPCL